MTDRIHFFYICANLIKHGVQSGLSLDRMEEILDIVLEEAEDGSP